ncbi:MAG: HAD family hydrolase, partial [candidate division Zixibacteria bacterium]|nr:HAD family hydrolase [candidate division Zixibacteria bacterium]
MTNDTTYRALITDMDGVLTRTARVHERAWKTMFDKVLKEHNESSFTHDDYRQYVDGKPRHDGVRDFLTSRNIDIDEGSPSDPAEHNTVYGLGKRKNDQFLRLIEQDGVETFPDAVAAVARWRRGQLPQAAFSASRNCQRILKAAGLIDQFDAIVDGETALEHNLDGKPELMSFAAEQLGVSPSETVVLEDATSGVRAGHESQFGLVIGINRGDHAEELDDAGAHRVVNSLSELRFKRAMPSALNDYAAIEQFRNERPVAIFLDYDGTLTPIVNDPDAANMDDDMRDVVRQLAATYPVAIVSGRARND